MFEDRDLETGIAAIIFKDFSLISIAAAILKPKHFFYPKIRNLYTVALDMWAKGESITKFALVEATVAKFGKHHDYDKFIDDITAIAPDATELEVRAKKLAEMYAGWKLHNALLSSAAALREGKLSGSSAIAEVESQVRKLADEETSSGELSTAEDCVILAINQLEKSFNGEVIGTPTHIKKYNEFTAGLVGGEWTVLAGRPGTGKTALAVDMLDEMCKDGSKNGIIFSLEMSKEQLIHRLIAKRTMIDFQKIRTGRLSKEEFSKVVDAAERISASSLLINDDPSITTYDIFSIASKQKNKLAREGKTLDVIVVDNLSILRPNKSNGSRLNDVTEMTRDFKIMVKKLGIHAIVIVHLNRNIEGRDGGEPRMSDLRECGTIEQDADVITILHKPDDQMELTNAWLLKNRGGPQAVVPLRAQLKYMKFTDYELNFAIP